MGTTAKKKYPKGFWICGCTSPIALAGVLICILPCPQVDDYVIFLYFYENTFAQSCF